MAININIWVARIDLHNANKELIHSFIYGDAWKREGQALCHQQWI